MRDWCRGFNDLLTTCWLSEITDCAFDTRTGLSRASPQPRAAVSVRGQLTLERVPARMASAVTGRRSKRLPLTPTPSPVLHHRQRLVVLPDWAQPAGIAGFNWHTVAGYGVLLVECKGCGRRYDAGGQER